jgi:hypothetical protein
MQSKGTHISHIFHGFIEAAKSSGEFSIFNIKLEFAIFTEMHTKNYIYHFGYNAI